jgi:type II secretory pathway pseudopilin PulG
MLSRLLLFFLKVLWYLPTMNKLALKNQSGQSLIEILTALTIVLLVIVALIKATSVSIKSGDYSKSQALATSYAQEAIEWVRAERDEDWDNVAGHTPIESFCLNDLSWSGGWCGYTLGDRFKRELSLSDAGGGNTIEVRVVVGWQDASGDHQSQLNTYLSNWR